MCTRRRGSVGLMNTLESEQLNPEDFEDWFLIAYFVRYFTMASFTWMVNWATKELTVHMHEYGPWLFGESPYVPYRKCDCGAQELLPIEKWFNEGDD